MEKLKKFLPYLSAIIIPGLMLAFNVGYSKAEIDKKPTRDEVRSIVDTAIVHHEFRDFGKYIEIEKVPGLKEQLTSMNEKLQKIDDRFDRIENVLIYGRVKK